MQDFVTANQQLRIQSASFMTQDLEAAPAELSGAEIESVIESSTNRIAVASNSITLRDYSALLRA